MHIYAISEKIDHKFLVSGHIFLPNDADFGVIERTTKKSALYVLTSDIFSLNIVCYRILGN